MFNNLESASDIVKGAARGALAAVVLYIFLNYQLGCYDADSSCTDLLLLLKVADYATVAVGSVVGGVLGDKWSQSKAPTGAVHFAGEESTKHPTPQEEETSPRPSQGMH